MVGLNPIFFKFCGIKCAFTVFISALASSRNKMNIVFKNKAHNNPLRADAGTKLFLQSTDISCFKVSIASCVSNDVITSTQTSLDFADGCNGPAGKFTTILHVTVIP